MRSLKSRRTGLFVSLVSAILLALAVLAPTGAAASPNSLTAETSDAYMKGSCDFDVTRNNNFETVTAKLTMKAVEVKPSIFSPRRVASATIICELGPNGNSDAYAFFKVNPKGATIYKSQYITVDYGAEYTVCATIRYTLRTGAEGFTTPTCVNS